MIIKQLTISGYKSFGRKTVFGLDSGITAVVGPNGSGKSNVADALRWVLGEQSLKTLRVKKTEDLIFAGTGSKARGSVAEVRVLFDNSDDALGLGFSEIELSRKLYGSGESDYRLNGRKVRLAEVQHLLAKARIGAGSYAIIGQGMIDSLVLASPAERKLLFDEASGIRQFELQRVEAVKKLRATEDNMQRARDVLAEMGPRLAILERNLEAAHRRSDLEHEVEALKAELQAARYQELRADINAGTGRLHSLAKRLSDVEAQTGTLTKRHGALAQTRKQQEASHKQASLKLRQLEDTREQLINDLSVRQAELQHLRERAEEIDGYRSQAKELEQKLRSAQSHHEDLEAKLAAAQASQKNVESDRDKLVTAVKQLQQRLVKQRKQIEEFAQSEYILHAQTIVTDLHRALEQPDIDKDHLQSLTFRVRRLLKLATQNNQDEVLGELRTLQTELGDAIRKRERIDEDYARATLLVRSLELDVASSKQAIEAARSRVDENAARIAQLEQTGSHIERRRQAIERLQEQLNQSQTEIQSYRERLTGAHSDVDELVAVTRQLEQLSIEHDGLRVEMKAIEAEIKDREAQLKQLTIPKTTTVTDRGAEELERAIVRAEARLEALSDAGLDAEAEHAEVKERHTFLESQLSDLEAAHANLEAIIAQLDTAIQAQFTSAFEELSAAFNEVFLRLFGGGSGRLVLQQADDQIGVEIEVNPPGKRIRHLTALSGGERSLAGLALLFAIVRINPSPILVLDEVDAALDEANADRFNRMLTELADHSQVVVITHNRQTMVTAGSLFGVTMDEDHVSQTVSVRLDEAAALAEA